MFSASAAYSISIQAATLFISTIASPSLVPTHDILLDTVIKYHQARQILGGVPSIMHFTTFVLPLLVTSLASAKSLSLFGSGQQPLDAKLDVPGDNPLQFCQTTSDYILLIQKVDLAPNPPKS